MTSNRRGRAASGIPFRILMMLTAVASMLVTSAVHGQGTDGSLADPITTRELMQYGDRLGLSDQQRTGIQSFHDAYKRDFRYLREGEIDAFLSETRSMTGAMPNRATVQDLFKNLSALRRKIRILDDRLFDQLQPMLSEEQIAMLPRVRLQRERFRYMSEQMTWFMGRPPVDLSEVVRSLELPGEVTEVVDPSLGQYERRLTTTMRKLSEASSRMYLDIFDRLEELGYGEMTQEEMMEDPERMQQMMTAMQNIWQEVTIKAQKLAAEIVTLNDRTYSSVRAAFVDDEHRRAFRDAYCGRAYPQVGALITTNDDAWLTRVLSLKELTDDQRVVAQDLADEHQRKMDRIIDDAIEVVRGSETNINPFEFDMEARNEAQRKIAELGKDAVAAQHQTRIALEEALKIDIAAKIASMDAEANAAAVAAETIPTIDVESPNEVVIGAGVDGLTPRPIAAADIRDYARRLDFDEGGRAIVDELHREYSDAYRDLPILAELRQTVSTLWHHDPATGQSDPPNDQAIARTFELRRRAFEQIKQLDAKFFEDVALAVTSKTDAPALDRIRNQRARQRWLIGHAPNWGGSSANDLIDLTQFVSKQRLSDETTEVIDAVLRQYEADAKEVFETRFHAVMEMQEAQERWNSSMAVASTDGTPSDWSQRFRDMLGAPNERMQAALKRLRELNQRTLDAMVEALDPAEARTLRAAFNRTAHPEVYADSNAVDEHLTKGLELEDLTAEQRSTLVELSSTYRPEYESLCRKMVEIRSSMHRNPLSFDTADWADYQEINARLERAGFDRDELSFRTISRLGDVLTTEQIARIGGLPEMKKNVHSATRW